MTDETKEIVKRTMHNLSMGDHISDEDLKMVLKILPHAVKILEAINRRQYDLVTNDIRQDLHRLESYSKARKEKSI